MRGAAAGAVVAGTAAAVVALAAAGGGHGAGGGATAPPAASLHVPAPVAPAFTPGRATGVDTAHLTHWAPVRHATVARAAPDAEAPAVARLAATTPEGTDTLVPVLARRDGAWVQVRLPVLPNGTTGWVRRAALGGYGSATTRLVVDRARLRATLYDKGKSLMSVPVAVGQAAYPTPAGTFLVRNRLTRYASAAYGPVAFGTSARSPKATDWPAGGFVGIHGTDRPDLVPGRVSHGCIRLRNADIERLAQRMPVGTTLTIR